MAFISTTILPTAANPNIMASKSKIPFQSSTALRRAYATCLAGDVHNLDDVVELAKGLSKADKDSSLVVTVPSCVPDIIRDILVREGCDVEEFKPTLVQDGSIEVDGELQSLLHLFKLVKYKKLAYMKAGMVVIGKTNELFELSEDGQFSAVPKCFCGNNEIGYCPFSDPTKLGSGPPLLRFNTDLFAFQPSVSTFNALKHKLLAKKAILGSGPGNIDQLLNSHFGDTYQPLDPMYNFHVDLLRHHPDKLHDAKVLGSGVGMLLKKVREEIEEVKSLDDDDTTITNNNSSVNQKKKSKWSSFKEWLSALLPCCGCICSCVQQQTGGIDFGSIADSIGSAFS